MTNLGTTAVESSLIHSTGAVKTDQLNTEEVLPRGNAARHSEVVPSVAGDNVVDTPDSSSSVKVILGKFEPVGAFTRSRGSVIHLSQPVGDGALVRRGNGIIGVVLSVDVGPQVTTDLGTGRDGENRNVGRARLAVGHVTRLDILDGEVGTGGGRPTSLPISWPSTEIVYCRS